MNLTAIKSVVRVHMTDDQIRAEYGDLRRRSTWEAAYERCSEAIALAADAANDAQEPATVAAETVCDALYSQQSRDVVQWVAAAILTVIFALGLIAVRLTQATWQASAPLRARASGRIHSEVWAFVGAWPDLLIGL